MPKPSQKQMFVRHQPPPSPIEQQRLRAAEPMWPVWVALTVLALSTGSLVAILVGFTGKSLHTSGWFWLAITLGTIAGLIALAFQTRSTVTRRMQTALIVSLIVHVMMTFVFKESFLSMFSQTGKKAGAVTKPMPTMPNYYMPSPTGATVRQAFDRPVETEQAETSTTEAIRNNEPTEFEPQYRPSIQQSDVAEVVEPTPMELERQSQAAPRRTNEMSRLSRQDMSQAKLAAPRNVRTPRQRFERPKQQRSELQAPDAQAERRQAEAPRLRRSSETTRQTAMANAAERQMERARAEETPRVANPSASRPNRTRAESSRIAETQARDLNPTPAQSSESAAAATAQASAEAAQRMSRSSANPSRAAASRAMANASATADQVAALSRSTTSRRSPSQLRPNLNAATAASNSPRRSVSAARSSSSSAANIAAPASAAAQSSAAGDVAQAPSSAAAQRMSGSSSGRPSRSRGATSGGGPPSNQLAAVGGIATSRRSSSSALAAGTSTATASGVSRSSSSSSRATTSGSASQIGAAAPAAGAPTQQAAEGPSASASQVARQRSGRSSRSNRRRSSANGSSDAETLAAAAASASSGAPQRRGDRSQPNAGGIAEAAPNTSMSRRSSRARALSGTDAGANAPEAPQVPTPGQGTASDGSNAIAAATDGQPTRRSARSGRPSRSSRGESGPASDQVAASAANTSSNRQPRRATSDTSTEPDLFDVARSPQTRRSNRRARMATSQSSADEVEAPAPVGNSAEDSASETVSADAPSPNSGIDRVASRVRVRNNAAPGSGGLASELAATSGIPSRRASRQSQLVHNAPERFLRKTAGGRASMSGKAREVHPAFARRTQRRTDPASKGALGQPSAEVEAAIEMGLAYVASIQQPDGRWSLQKTVPNGAADPDPTASIRADSAATGLALLSFLGAGYDHLEDRYAKQVAAGLEFLIANQKSNGDLFVQDNPNAKNDGLWFYCHGIAAIALCEAYGMTGDPQLKQPAQKAIDFIVASQHPERGGWRYDPNRMSDLSVSGWQLMAIRSGQLAGLRVPESAIKGTQRLLDAAQASPDDGSQYCYNPWGNDTEKGRYGPRPNTTMTAVGLMMRLYTGWKKDRPDMQRGADHLADHLPIMQSPPGFAGTGNPQRDTYYWYSGTIVMYHLQGEHWQKWKEKLYPMLASTQQRDGQLVGSWNPRKPMSDRWAISAGRLYLTTLNLLSLEVHHRHLPLFSDGLELQNE